MAFPKTQSGSDLMIGAPSPVTSDQLDALRLRIVED
jgi:aspartyl-tRNA synthetase